MPGPRLGVEKGGLHQVKWAVALRGGRQHHVDQAVLPRYLLHCAQALLLHEILERHKIGDKIMLQLARGSKTYVVEISLESGRN